MFWVAMAEPISQRPSFRLSSHGSWYDYVARRICAAAWKLVDHCDLALNGNLAAGRERELHESKRILFVSTKNTECYLYCSLKEIIVSHFLAFIFSNIT